ncbi:MAG: hypothetical protein Q7I94_07595 [Candidatus Contubernalis sp.]|nr:hypothetical protein [Candidatus Contubernalis sp.]
MQSVYDLEELEKRFPETAGKVAERNCRAGREISSHPSTGPAGGCCGKYSANRPYQRQTIKEDIFHRNPYTCVGCKYFAGSLAVSKFVEIPPPLTVKTTRLGPLETFVL